MQMDIMEHTNKEIAAMISDAPLKEIEYILEQMKQSGDENDELFFMVTDELVSRLKRG